MPNKKRKPVTLQNHLLTRRGVPGLLLSKHAAKQEFKVTDRELATLTTVDYPNPNGEASIKFYLLRDLFRLAYSPPVQARHARKAIRQGVEVGRLPPMTRELLKRKRDRQIQPETLRYESAKAKYGLTDAELRTIPFLQVPFPGRPRIHRIFKITDLEKLVRMKRRK